MRTINHIILECPTFENLRVDFFLWDHRHPV